MPGVHAGGVNVLADQDANVAVAVADEVLHANGGTLFEVGTHGGDAVHSAGVAMSTRGIPWTGIAQLRSD